MKAWRTALWVWGGLTLLLTLAFLTIGTESLAAVVTVGSQVFIKHLVLSGVITAPVGILVLLFGLRRNQMYAAEMQLQAQLGEPLPEGVVEFRYAASLYKPIIVLIMLIPLLLHLARFLYQTWQNGTLTVLGWLVLLLLLVLAFRAWEFLCYLRVAIDGGQVVKVTDAYVELPRLPWRQEMVRLSLSSLKAVGVSKLAYKTILLLSDSEQSIFIPQWLMSRLMMERMSQLIRARALKAMQAGQR